MLSLDRILVPTDFSPCADQALRHAAFLARQVGAGMDLVHVIPVAPGYPLAGVSATETQDADAVRTRLEELVDDHDLGALDVRCHVERGEAGVGRAVLQAAERLDVGLIALGTHGRQGVRRLFLGSEAEEVIRGADRPVLAVRQRDDAPAAPSAVRRILVPTDLSTHSRHALAHAVALAHRYDAHVQLLHVVQPAPDYDLPGMAPSGLPPQTDVADALAQNAHTELSDQLAQLDLPADRCSMDVQHGDPASTIVDTAAETETDLIVLASHGRTGLERFLMGSVAEKTIRSTPCPVFVVKAYGRRLVEG